MTIKCTCLSLSKFLILLCNLENNLFCTVEYYHTSTDYIRNCLHRISTVAKLPHSVFLSEIRASIIIIACSSHVEMLHIREQYTNVEKTEQYTRDMMKPSTRCRLAVWSAAMFASVFIKDKTK